MVKITPETHSAEELYALSRRTKDRLRAIRLRAVAMALEAYGRDAVTCWGVADIAARIEPGVGVQYTVEGVRCVLRRQGFRHVSARPLHLEADA